MYQFRAFFKNEDGAVTVDWVILTGFIIAISIIAVAAVFTTVTDPLNDLNEKITARANESGGG